MMALGRRLGYSGNLAVLLTTIVGTNIGYTALLPYLPRLSERLGLSATELAIFLTGFAVTKILGQPVGGYLADSWGLRATALVGLVAAAIGMSFIIFADTAEPAILGRLIWGAADGVLTPVLYRSLTVISAEHGRDPTSGYAHLGSVAVLSFAGGPLVVGLVYPFADYPAVLAATAGLTLVNALVAWAVLPDRARSAPPAEDVPAAGSERFGPLLRAIAFFAIVDLFANLLWAAAEPLVPLYLGRAYEDPTGRAAWVLGIGMLVFAAANQLLARLSDWWRLPRMAGLGLAALGVSCIALNAVAVLAWGLIGIAVFMVAQAYIYLIARRGIQQYGGGTGRAWGIFGMFGDTGLVLGSVIAVWLFEVFGTRAFSLLGVGALLAAAVLAVAVRGLRPGPVPAGEPDRRIESQVS
ncbi:MFS transporter [Micromonospora sp. NPDC050686]|uniref:MFS transporter n=1 Tax=Micromonospora sp. NPDC050686 TaxID=3154631 RepID=UPI0033F64802